MTASRCFSVRRHPSERQRSIVTGVTRQNDKVANDYRDALQFFYAQPYSKRLRYQGIKALAEAIKAPISSWFAVSLAGATLLWIGVAPGFLLKLAELASVPLAP